MAKRKQRRRPRQTAPTVDYTDDEGNVLTLRQTLSAGTIAKIGEPPAAEATRWTTPGGGARSCCSSGSRCGGDRRPPLTDQAMLLGRYRMADPAMQGG